MIRIKKILLLCMFVIPSILYSCGDKGNNIMGADSNNEILNPIEEPTEFAVKKYGEREPEMAIQNEEAALEIGTAILKNYYPFTTDATVYGFSVKDKGDYWRVGCYEYDTTDENGNIIGWAIGGGVSVTFRKSDCKIIDIGHEE